MVNRKNNLFFLSFLLLFLLTQFFLVDNDKFIFLQLSILITLLIIVISFHQEINIQLFLLILAILPFIYIERKFSRYYTSIIIQNIPLMLLFILFVFEWVKNTRNYIIKIHYLFFPVFIYLLFSIWLSIYGLLQGNSSSIIFIEIYQAFYFILIFPMYYLLHKRNSYLLIFSLLVIVFSIVSIEYIVLNILSPIRVTTYHNHIFPLIIGVSFAGLIFLKKKKHKTIALFIFLIIWLGSIATETRTLWISNLFAMSIVYLLYLRNKGVKLKYIFGILAFTILLLTPILFDAINVGGQVSNSVGEKRVESIANPLGDISFLMRVEAVYLSYNQIRKKPLLGYGFGHLLQMKYLLQTAYLFPDNNYLYYWLKGGIFYLLIVLWMFYRLLKVTYKLFSIDKSDFIKFIMAGLFAGIIGIMSFALLNANLVKLRLNFIYAIIFAYVNFEYQTYLKKKSNV